MPSSHLILCYPLLLLPPISPSIRVFSNESTLCIRWPKFGSFSFNISPSNEHPVLIFWMDWLDLLAIQGTLKVFSNTTDLTLIQIPAVSYQLYDIRKVTKLCASFLICEVGIITVTTLFSQDFPGGSEVKVSTCNLGDPGSIPGPGRSPGEGNSIYSSILAWRIPWTEEPGMVGLVGPDWVTSLFDLIQPVCTCGRVIYLIHGIPSLLAAIVIILNYLDHEETKVRELPG